MLLPILTIPLILGACGPSEAPKCSDALVQNKVVTVFLLPVERKFTDGKIYNGRNELAYSVDFQAFRNAFSFVFSDERERTYDSVAHKRYCTANISGNFASIEAERALTTVPTQYNMLTPAQAIASMTGMVKWSDPQNYSVQYTDKGDLYVTVDE